MRWMLVALVAAGCAGDGGSGGMCGLEPGTYRVHLSPLDCDPDCTALRGTIEIDESGLLPTPDITMSCFGEAPPREYRVDPCWLPYEWTCEGEDPETGVFTVYEMTGETVWTSPTNAYGAAHIQAYADGARWERSYATRYTLIE